MQNTTADYKIEINKPSRSFECKITIGNNIYTNEDLVNLTLEFTQPQEGFSIGGTISKSLDLTLLNRGDIIYSTSQIKVEIGLKIGSKIEYILMGLFNIDDIEKTDYTTKFTAYDNMIKFETDYFSELGDKPTLQQVVNELSSKTGVEFTGSLPAYTVSKLGGFSCREVLSYVASICGGNALITRDGKFTIKSLGEVEKSIDGSNYFNYTREEVKYKVGQISCQVDENNILSKGSTGTDSMELAFENPWVTETILTEIYNKLNGLSYLGYSMKWQGDLSLDPYDIITVTDVKNVVRKIPILSQKITYTGGLTSEIGAKGETKNKNSFSSSGSTTNKVNRAVIEQAIIKEALIEKANIKDLEAVSIRTQTLEAKTAKIEEAIIDVAHIKDLNAINANIQNLIAADATINNALIGKADITELNAVKGTINVLESDTANIKNLLAGNITGESGQLIHLTASNVVIADAVIKNLIASNISVEDLKASKISTNKFTIASTDGGLSIVGPTMQFKDKNNKVRIQMGQDATGNFNFILRGEDGTTTLIDHTGIKEKAIADNLIKENMVAADAIGEKQINYSSLITGLNKDTNTSLIKASKVAIDLTGQSLEVAFNSLKSNVDKIEIGGRNLLVNSSFTENATNWIFVGLQIVTEDNKKCAKLSGLIGDNTMYVNQTLMGKLEPNQTYTISGWVKLKNVKVGTTNPTLMYYVDGNYNNNGTATWFGYGSKGFNRNSSKWEYVTWTFTTDNKLNTASSCSFYVHCRDYTGDVFFYNLKLEKGNKATDWTPAPEDIDSKIESNTTSISIAQGKIDGLIAENTIIKGDVTTISNKYTSLKATVDGINTTVASHTSSIGNINTNISGLSGKVTIVENNYASLSQNLEGFKTTVGNTYSTKNELSAIDGKVISLDSRVNTAESSITQLNNKIDLKVEATDITAAIDNIQIGGRNYIIANRVISYTPYNIITFKVAGYIKSTWTSSYTGDLFTIMVEGFVPKKAIYTLSGTIKVNGAIPTSKYFINYATTYGGNLIRNDYDAKTGKFVITQSYPGDSTWILHASTTRSGGSSDVVELFNLKFEEGNKATDFTVAQEDVDISINNVQTQITTTSNKIATIETNLNSITQRVSSTETTTITMQNTVNNLKSAHGLAYVKDIVIYGESNKYYPVYIRGGNQDVLRTIKIWRSYWEQAPYEWGNSDTHKGALTLEWQGNFGGWGGATYKEKIIDYSWLYSELLADCHLAIHSMGYVFFLRGGGNSGAIYHFASDQDFTPEIYYNGSNDLIYNHENPAYNVYAHNPLTTVNIDRLNGLIVAKEASVTTVKNQVATIETNLNSITSRVSSTESTVATINGNVTSLQSRMTTAEQKITPTAITTTISETITGGKGSISTTQFIMDKNGLTIKNGALKIQNKAGTTVFNSDTNGNLIFTGTAKSIYGEQWVSLDAGGVTFQDYHRNEQMLRVGLSYFNSNRDMNGVNFALARYGDFIRFSHIAKTDLTNGWSSSDTQYNFMDFWSSDQTVGGISYKKGINAYAPMYINNGVKFINDSNYTSDILGNFSWNTITNMLGICGDNGLFLGYRNGSEYNARLVLTEASHPGTGDNIRSWGNWNCSGFTVHNGTFSGNHVNSYANTLTRTFAETHCIEAENKQVRINFKDIQLVNGKAILNIPNKYNGICIDYIIASIVKKGKGDVWVAEEQESRFVIEGTEDIKVNVEVIIILDNSSSYSIKNTNDEQLCLDMTKR